MSLSFDLSHIDNYEERCYQQIPGDGARMHPVTHALIFHTIGAGLHEITEKNQGEFWARVNMREKLHGAMCWMPNAAGDDIEPYLITAEDVANHIGLHTNASFKRRADWALELFEHAYDLPSEEDIIESDWEDDEDDY